ncbi:MAG: sigma-54 dependent transcriptional regulator [Fibrobacterota bacterium]
MFGIYSTLPNSQLYLWKMGEGNIMAVVMYPAIFSNLLFFRQESVIILDEKGAIQGFNLKFYRFFSKSNLTSDQLLSKPVEDYLSPNPLSLICPPRERLLDIVHEPWNTLSSFSLPLPDIEDPAFLFENTDLSIKNGRLCWSPWTDRTNLLRIRKALDTRLWDIRIDMTFEVIHGSLPSAILFGSDYDRFLFPDWKGYLLGYNRQETCFHIKKEGEIVNKTTEAYCLTPGKHTLVFIKRKQNLVLFLDNEPILHYLDFEPLAEWMGHQFLCAEGPAEIFIDAFSLSTLPVANIAKGEIQNECHIRNPADTTVSIHQIFDYRATHINHRFYYVFSLYDVSHFTRNIKALQAERDRFKSLSSQKTATVEPMVGVSAAIIKIRENAKIAADSAVNILIEGETGTGKEVLARFIHQNSPFAEGPFVKVDCSALPLSLLESELFGHERGAFTGAEQKRMGRFEAAEGGTLFLDEIGNLSMEIQVKLLQFIQDFSVVRIGSNRNIKVNTRLIAASNHRLKDRVEKGGFRSDLFYRLNTVYFYLPPLRERKEDIPNLCHYFVNFYNKRLSRSAVGFSGSSLQKIMQHDWPGNIRELENVIQNALLFSHGKQIKPDALNIPSTIPALPVENNPAQGELTIPYGNSRALTRDHLLQLLKKNNGIIKQVAQEAHISKSTLFRKMKRFDISIDQIFGA